MINCLLNRIAEPEQILTQKEKSLYISWLNQTFDTTNLHTVEGQTLSILQPGERNETEGPDFHNAMILIDGRFEQGDVELHLNSEDWYRHNHNRDPHYDAVILHVVLKAGKTIPIRSNQNRIIPTLQITPFETISRTYACEQWRQISIPDLKNVLRKFAEIRFLRKAQTFRNLIMTKGLEQSFYEGLADVMGYSRNRRPFCELAGKLPVDLLQRILTTTPLDQRIITLESLLFGTAGFFTVPEYKKHIRDTNYVRGLIRLWRNFSKKYRLSELEKPQWHFAGSRPSNFPTLRIAALAQIFYKFHPAELAESWIRILSNTRNYQSIKEWASEKFQQPDGLWRNHPLLKRQPGQLLMGPQRFSDLMSNLLLPFGWATGSVNTDQAIMAECIHLAEQVECYESPGIVKTALGRLSVNAREIKNNYLIQGMIEFIHRYCNINLCKICPLEKYAK